MDSFEKCLISTIIYYHFLNRPLTSVELFKYLNAGSEQLDFGNFLQRLSQSKTISALVKESQGFYFLAEADIKDLFAERQRRSKISQQKWKKIRRTIKILQLAPFIQMIGVTGSLTLENARPESDFDFLIILKPGRLWTGRMFITLILSGLGWRRHGQKTKNRVCLNCYLASHDLGITSHIKPHDLHSAQEYSRMTPVFEAQPNIFASFCQANSWIGELCANWPWPNILNFKYLAPAKPLAFIKKIFEAIFSGRLGDWFEKTVGRWQAARIRKKTEVSSPSDQIYFSDQCLMFHPRSKSLNLLTSHRQKLEELNSFY